MNQVTHRLFCHILVENIVRKRSMSIVHMELVTFYVIQVAVHPATSMYLFPASVPKNRREYHALLPLEVSSTVKMSAESS